MQLRRHFTSVQDPGTLKVTCDGCGEEQDFNTTEYAGDPLSWGVDDATLTDQDWTAEDGETFCPACSKEKARGD